MTPPYTPPPGSIPTFEVPSLAGIHRVHLIGIGGAGMSGVARLLLARGVEVRGSDLKDSRGLEDLRDAGASVFVGHRAEQLTGPDGALPDAVVISSAVPEGNPELAEARTRGLPVLARAQVLAALAAGRRTLAVSGTHGKTTTTSMLSVILDRAGLDPTFVIGGDLNEIGSGARHGEGDVFVAEADESDGSFLLFHADVAVITNVEEDHLDFYTGGRAEIEAAFGRFAEQAERVVACGDDPGARSALEMAGCDAVTYGTAPENLARLTVTDARRGRVAGTLDLGDGRAAELGLSVAGAHNLLNAAGAVVAASVAGVPTSVAARAAGTFTGVRRRFEHRGAAAGAEFYDDYAHHPTEVAVTLAAASRDGYRRLVAVFQPHRYTRTQSLWRELGESLTGADLVVVTDVYGAGEEPIPGVSGKLLVDALAA
ncbi:MAG: UDP-N-acetylmuramate--L-alanine ligase, partial [Actinobacteria bacterium]|nr:UDP-N-acetylmuramate--L-alanine ligase [Actinomycetota bacterium]